MNADANKNISSIQYNYLNLPAVITVTGKGTISYVYDAAGNKIQKTVAESGQPSKTTLYLGGAVYENDVMQFTGHEEGRIRFSPAAGAQPNALYYDYMVKDHLGNVRMVLTEEVQTKSFPPASMEPAEEGNESQYYTNINSTIRSTKPANYPADSYTSPNQYAAKLRGDAGTTKIGPAILLKVMAGDKFHLRVNSWWSYGAGGSLSAPNPLTELASVLANGIAGASGGKVTAIDLNNSGLTGTAATSFLSTQNGALTTRPRAFVNWVLLDENFNIAKDSAGGYIRDGYSNFQQVGDADAFTTHSLVNAPINKNGYLYIYVSNQSPNMDVYFDNLQVTHIKGPILEENHYSPWGMTLAALSSKAISGAAENKFKYNGKEEQKKEFADGSGLDWLDYGARMYDQQIGRWHRTDNKAELYLNITPYAYAADQPTNAIDPDGNLVIFINGFTLVAAEKGTERYWRSYKDLSRQYWDRNGRIHDQVIQVVDKAFDLEVSKQLNDDHRWYVHGGNAPAILTRFKNGEARGYEEAEMLIASLHRTNGVIDETIKIVTHSMGAVYGDGYIRGLKKYLNEHPELKKQVQITLIADFDPFQASAIKNNGKTRKQQYTHFGGVTGIYGTADEMEKGEYEYFENEKKSSHSILSFFDDISKLQEGTYKWNDTTQEWELQKNKKQSP
jgi:RHS repeat-associated protein